jgi:hypothetical protein
MTSRLLWRAQVQDGALIGYCTVFIHSSFFYRGETTVDCSGMNRGQRAAKGMYHASTAVFLILTVLLFERIMFMSRSIRYVIFFASETARVKSQMLTRSSPIGRPSSEHALIACTASKNDASYGMGVLLSMDDF